MNFIKRRKRLCLIGIKRAFVSKEKGISTNKKTVYMGVNFFLINGMLLDLKTKTHCLLTFLCYVIQFINL